MLFWPDTAPENARASLRQTLSRLRIMLGEAQSALWSDANDIGLVRARWRFDIDDLPARLAAGGPIGDFMAGHHLALPAVQNWLDAERRHWLAKVLEVYQARLSGLLASQADREAITVSRAILALDPLQEHTHRQLMMLLAEGGEVNAALQQFHTLEVLLKSELGIEPDAESRALAQKLRNMRSQSPRTTPAPAPADALTPLRLITALAVQWSGAAQDASPETADAVSDILGTAGARELTRQPDQMIFTFGHDQTREEDAARALQAAQSCLDHAASDMRFGCALGLTTGEGPYDLNGSAVSEAQTLAAMAEPGEILTSAGVRAQVGPLAGWTGIDIRGRRFWQFGGMTDRYRRPRFPLIGRTPERAQMEQALDDLSRGRGSATIVTGDAGIGKTRLTEAVCETAEARGYVVVTCAFDAFKNDAQPLRPHLAQLLAHAVSPPLVAEDFELSLRQSARILLAGAGVEAPDYAESPGYQSLFETFFIRMCQMMSARQPLVLWIEDSHWANPGQLDFFLTLHRRLKDTPVAFIFTERGGARGVSDLLLSRQKPDGLRHVNLLPLSPQEASDLLQLAQPDLPIDEAVVARASGNPLFLLGLADLGSDGADELPTSVLSLVQQQLDLTPPDVRAACYRAAILGQSFTNRAFDAIFAGFDRGQLIRSGFLRCGTDRSEFTHEAIQEAIYALVPAAMRAGFHRLAADYFRTRNPVLWAEHALRIARNREAGEACYEASELLLPQFRFEAGRRYIDLGLSCDISDDLRALMVFSLGSISREQGDFDAALDHYRAASELAEDPNIVVQTALRRWSVLKFLGRLDEGRTLLKTAVRLGAEDPRVSLLVRSEIAQEQANDSFQRGDGAACLTHSSRALELATEGGHQLQRARALGGVGDAYYALLQLRKAQAAFTDCVDLSVQHGFSIVANAHRHMAALCHFYVDPGVTALEEASAAYEQVKAAGSVGREILALSIMGEIAGFLGDTAVLDDVLTQLDAFGPDQQHRFAGDILVVRIYKAWLAGDVDGAADLARQGAVDHHDVFLGPQFCGLFAVLTRNDTARRQHLEQGLALLDQGGLAHSLLCFYHCAMQACVAAGWAEEAERFADAFAARLDPAEIGFARLSLALTKAQLSGDGAALAAAQGEIEAAGLALFLQPGSSGHAALPLAT